MNALTPHDCAAVATDLYASAPLLTRTLQRYRPHICPFHRLMQYVPQGATVLDVGCGAGLFLGLLAHSGRISQGEGFDASRAAIAVAQGMAERCNALRHGRQPRVDLRLHHLAVNDSWPRETFDVVSLIDVMHHVPANDRAALVEQICLHVRPGGRLIYKDIAPRPRWRAAANRLHDLILARQWVRYQETERVVAWCQQRGLNVVVAERIDMLWYGHDLRVLERP